ncbi:MAG: hypothetical protein Roseis2KO_51120 [Roseivirga sp.]
MEKHFELTDREFETQFENLTLNPALFSHEAHIRLAWIHINQYGLNQAIENISTQIKAFAAFHGDADKYNHTVTIAAVRAVYHFILKAGIDNFSDFISTHPRLKTSFRQLIEAHYSTNIFASLLAKDAYLEPDLLPFD